MSFIVRYYGYYDWYMAQYSNAYDYDMLCSCASCYAITQTLTHYTTTITMIGI